MFKRIHSLGIIALVAVSAVALATQGLSVKRVVKEGQVLKYKLQGSIEIPQLGTINVRGLMEEKVTKVEADGTYTVVQTQLEGFASQGNNPEQAMEGQAPSTTKMNPRGEVVEIVTDADPVAAWRMAGLNMFIEPGKPLNVGDKWSHDIKANEKTGAVEAKAEYTVLGEEKVGAVDTIKVKFSVKESAGTEPAASDGTVWIDKKDGSPVQVETKLTRAPFPTPAGTFALDGTMKLTRVDG